MMIELNERQLQLIRYAVANTGNRAKADAAKQMANGNRSAAAGSTRTAEEFLAIERYLYERIRGR